MKKWVWVLPVLALGLATGCSNKPSPGTSSSKTSVSQTTSKKKASSSKASTPEASSSSQQASSNAESSSSKPEATVTDRLATLTAAAKQQFGAVKLPTTYQAASGKSLNIAATGDASNYVFYLSEGTAAAYNAAGLPTAAAPLAIQKFTTSTDTNSQGPSLMYHAPEAGLPTVAIGDNLTATKEGAAGAAYLNWLEGRWSITVQAETANGEDPLPLAQQAVALLAKQMLPIPSTHGAIILRVGQTDARPNSVTWREGNVLYQVSGVDPMATLQLAVTVRTR